MKQLFFLLVILTALNTTSAQGIDFYHGTWEEAKALAKEERKLIFVDAYAKWCGPCKIMARTVFTNGDVGSFYNQKFINMKIDMEEPMGREFGRSYPVGAYPTLFYIDSDGEIVKKIVGAQNPNSFLNIGKEIVDSYDKSGTYAERYEKGDRSFELVYEYIKSLNHAKKPSQKIANDYLRNHNDLKKDDRTRFIYEAMTTVDSRIFDLYTADKSNIVKLLGEEAYEKRVEEAAWNTVNNAIDFEVKELLSEASNKVTKHLSRARSQPFAEKANYIYALSTTDVAMMSAAAEALAKGSLQSKPKELIAIVDELKLYQDLYPKMKKTTALLMEQVVQTSDDPKHQVKYIEHLSNTGNTRKAIKEAKKALKNIPSDQDEYKMLSLMIEQLQNK